MVLVWVILSAVLLGLAWAAMSESKLASQWVGKWAELTAMVLGLELM